ncbi:MAG: hypothetical protein AAF961_06120, partial [Planctomycetota bacterium]
IADLAIVSDAQGYLRLLSAVSNSSDIGRAGRLYELQAASELVRSGAVSNIEFVSKFSRTAEGRTDIDIIADGVYYQVKISKDAFRQGGKIADAPKKAQAWVAKARQDAIDSGILDPVIKYIVPSADVVPDSVQAFFDNPLNPIEVLTLPLP